MERKKKPLLGAASSIVSARSVSALPELEAPGKLDPRRIRLMIEGDGFGG
jgi:hypothetical protein